MRPIDKIRSTRGMVAAIASKLGISRQAVIQWDPIPIDRVPTVEQVTGIPRHELRPDRPDLFPPPRNATAAA